MSLIVLHTPPGIGDQPTSTLAIATVEQSSSLPHRAESASVLIMPRVELSLRKRVFLRGFLRIKILIHSVQ